MKLSVDIRVGPVLDVGANALGAIMSEDPAPRESKSESQVMFQSTMTDFDRTAEEISNLLQSFQHVPGQLSTIIQNEYTQIQENLNVLAAELDKIDNNPYILPRDVDQLVIWSRLDDYNSLYREVQARM